MTLYQLNKFKKLYLQEKQNYLFSIKKNILGGTFSNNDFYLGKKDDTHLLFLVQMQMLKIKKN